MVLVLEMDRMDRPCQDDQEVNEMECAVERGRVAWWWVTFQIGIHVLDLIGLYRANIVCPNTQCVVCPPYLPLFRRNYGM